MSILLNHLREHGQNVSTHCFSPWALPFRESRAPPSSKTLKVCKSGMKVLLLEKFRFSCSTRSPAKFT